MGHRGEGGFDRSSNLSCSQSISAISLRHAPISKPCTEVGVGVHCVVMLDSRLPNHSVLLSKRFLWTRCMILLFLLILISSFEPSYESSVVALVFGATPELRIKLCRLCFCSVVAFSSNLPSLIVFKLGPLEGFICFGSGLGPSFEVTALDVFLGSMLFCSIRGCFKSDMSGCVLLPALLSQVEVKFRIPSLKLKSAPTNLPAQLLRPTSACLMKRPAAALSSVMSLVIPADSAALIFSKYCLTRVNSPKTGCSLELTPLSRR